MCEQREIIHKPFLILCEGKDARNFLIGLLNSDCLKHDLRYSNDIDIHSFGGVNDLSSYLKALSNIENFDIVSSILIIRDAEKDYSKAQNKIKESLKKSGFSVPDESNKWYMNHDAEHNNINIAYCLFPACDKKAVNGALEHLCWDILNEESTEIKESVTDYIERVKKISNCEFPREFKNILHTYFSIKDRFVTMKIGEAAKAKAFNWENEKLSPLKRIISEGFTENDTEAI